MMENKYKVLIRSDNIDYVQLNMNLIDDYLLMINDEDIQKKTLKKRKVYTYDSEVDWIKEKLETNAVIFSMIERKSGSFIGNVEFTEINDNLAEFEICITPAYQNKHYGTEAIKTMIDYGFNKINLKRINLVVFSNNYRAIHCYKKLGFTEYKVEKGVFIIDGELVDDVYMTLDNGYYSEVRNEEN